MVINDCEELV
jgi:hypothetical protein